MRLYADASGATTIRPEEADTMLLGTAMASDGAR
jgi:hypothetical protein